MKKQAGNSKDSVPQDLLDQMMSMGFPEKKCKKALLSCDNNLERASDWLFSHMDDEVSDSEMQGDVQGGEPKYKCSSE